MSVHLNPMLPATRDLILVGDPRRAFALGQSLTVQPEMSHLARGLWGYRGVTEEGLELTVQATGVGGPSAVAVISDLIGLGAERVIRLGTCTAVGCDVAGEAIEPGRAFLVSAARCFDGASRALTNGESEVLPDPRLLEALRGIAEPTTVQSHDLTPRMDRPAGQNGKTGSDAAPEAGRLEQAPLRDLQTAATLACAKVLGAESAAVLLVSEDASGRRLNEAELEAEFKPLGLEIARALELLSNPEPEG
ncbi:MAG: hypothetical protein WEB05_03620 [Solirubrobacterales bacterium]